MAKAFILLAITTFSDLNTGTFSAILYDCINAVEPRLCPEQAGRMGDTSRPLHGAFDFAALWREDRRIYTRETRGSKRGGKPRATGMTVGVNWKRRSAIKSEGWLHLRGATCKNQADALVIRADWRARVDWPGLFRSVCLLTDSAHGLLHLYTPDERAAQARSGTLPTRIC